MNLGLVIFGRVVPSTRGPLPVSSPIRVLFLPPPDRGRKGVVGCPGTGRPDSTLLSIKVRGRPDTCTSRVTDRGRVTGGRDVDDTGNRSGGVDVGGSEGSETTSLLLTSVQILPVRRHRGDRNRPPTLDQRQEVFEESPKGVPSPRLFDGRGFGTSPVLRCRGQGR